MFHLCFGVLHELSFGRVRLGCFGGFIPSFAEGFSNRTCWQVTV